MCLSVGFADKHNKPEDNRISSQMERTHSNMSMSLSIKTTPKGLIYRLFLIFAALAVPAIFWAWPTMVVAAGGGIEVIRDERKVDFPTGLNFTITAESDDDIVEVQLLYRTANSQVWSYAYANVVPGKRITSNVSLMIGRPVYLPPGVDVEYYYVITDAQGNTHTTDVQSVQYLDGRYHWDRTQIGSLTLLYHELSGSTVRSVSLEVKEALSHIRSLLQLENPGPMRGVIYNSNSEAQSAFPRQSQTITDQHVFGGFAFPANSIFVGVGFQTRIITHEAAHLLMDQAVGSRALPVPSWLDEGFASYVEPRSKAYSGSSLRRRGLSLRSMTRISGTPQSIGTFYQKAESVVSYMIEEFGVDTFQHLIGNLSQGLTIDQALTQSYGFDVLGLETRWVTDDGPPAAPGPGRQTIGTPWASFSTVVIGGLAVVVMAAWVMRFVIRKLRPEYPGSESSEEGLQPWEDPDLIYWEDEE